jgi:hypothetical protein
VNSVLAAFAEQCRHLSPEALIARFAAFGLSLAPSWAWSRIESVVGGFVFVAFFFQRRYDPRWRWNGSPVKALGQFGLWMQATLALLACLDGFADTGLPPVYAVTILFSIVLIQASVLAERWRDRLKQGPCRGPACPEA